MNLWDCSELWLYVLPKAEAHWLNRARRWLLLYVAACKQASGRPRQAQARTGFGGGWVEQ